MKTKSTIYVYLLFILLTITFSSCKSDSNEDPLITKQGEVTDIDGNIYKTVTIGTQVWMAENLKTTKYRNGDPISNVTGPVTWDNLTTGALCDYNNSQNSTAKFGKLYNWYSVSDIRNIAPNGWKVPSSSDWETLTTYLGGENIAGGKLKEKGVTNWISPNLGATNSTGFTALPSGGRVDNGVYSEVGESTSWWASDVFSKPSEYAFSIYILSNTEEIGRTFVNRYYGFSVRCIKE